MRRLPLSTRMRWSLPICPNRIAVRKDIFDSEDIPNISKHVKIENYKRNGAGDAVGNR